MDSSTQSKRMLLSCTDGSYVGVTVYADGTVDIFVGVDDGEIPELSVELSDSERAEFAAFIANRIRS